MVYFVYSLLMVKAGKDPAWSYLNGFLDSVRGSGILWRIQVCQEQGVDECRLPQTWFSCRTENERLRQRFQDVTRSSLLLDGEQWLSGIWVCIFPQNLNSHHSHWLHLHACSLNILGNLWCLLRLWSYEMYFYFSQIRFYLIFSPNFVFPILIFSEFHFNSVSFKGTVHPKMKITSWFTHPQAILGVYGFLTNTIRVILRNVLALPSFIMAVNGCRGFEAQKSASIHHKKCSTRLCF